MTDKERNNLQVGNLLEDEWGYYVVIELRPPVQFDAFLQPLKGVRLRMIKSYGENMFHFLEWDKARRIA